MERALQKKLAKYFLTRQSDITYNGRQWFVTFTMGVTQTHPIPVEIVKRAREELADEI